MNAEFRQLAAEIAQRKTTRAAVIASRAKVPVFNPGKLLIARRNQSAVSFQSGSRS
jgi:hypothetical protein